MPSLFISHGAPDIVIQQNQYTSELTRFGTTLAGAKAIVVASAHWVTPAGAPIAINAAPHPPLIYDFGGFDRSLYSLQYPAPGNPQLAGRIDALLRAAGVPSRIERERGWDHGAWIPLALLAPQANIPVVEISIPARGAEDVLTSVGRALAPLRDEGVVLLGSGGVVHNLRLLRIGAPDAPVEEWATAFDRWFVERFQASDFESIRKYRTLAPHVMLAAPTTDHFDPIFFTAGSALPGDIPTTIVDGMMYSTLSMRCLALQPVAVQ
jgi:4,5-DOPA dioxygenase extradiol